MRTHEDEQADATAAAVLGALPASPLDPGLSRRALAAAQTELTISRSGWRRTERFVAHILVPAALLASAAGALYHFVQVADHIYVSHDD